MIRQSDIRDLQAAFQANPSDLGVGLYNPMTGEIRLGSFDRVALGGGHQGLADACGIPDTTDWRGFVISADGKFVAQSHLNLADGELAMKPDLASQVEAELRAAGLIS